MTKRKWIKNTKSQECVSKFYYLPVGHHWQQQLLTGQQWREKSLLLSRAQVQIWSYGLVGLMNCSHRQERGYRNASEMSADSDDAAKDWASDPELLDSSSLARLRTNWQSASENRARKALSERECWKTKGFHENHLRRPLLLHLDYPEVIVVSAPSSNRYLGPSRPSLLWSTKNK